MLNEIFILSTVAKISPLNISRPNIAGVVVLLDGWNY